MSKKKVKILYGKDGMELFVPENADILENQKVPAITNYEQAIDNALSNPIGSESLGRLLKTKNPTTVAITISDITRPVPNKLFLPNILRTVNQAGIDDSRIVIIVGTGMHRPSTREELKILVGDDILDRIKVIDHTADKPDTLIEVCQNPTIRVCKRFVEADFRIVTGYIEPHFMAGFSGGRKGVCPALVDLETIKRFHGYKTLLNPASDTGILNNNPCHEIALEVAKKVGVDFLFNVAITKDRKIAGIYCGDLEKAHAQGCTDVAKWTTIKISKPYDIVITNGGGHPLDKTFYQTVKGMCTALPALNSKSIMLMISECAESLGSESYTELMLKYSNNWQRFLSDIASKSDEVIADQWEFQMQTRVLQKIGIRNLFFVSDGIAFDIQKRISVTPVLGKGNALIRAQMVIDKFQKDNPNATIGIVPEGPYTMILTACRQQK